MKRQKPPKGSSSVYYLNEITPPDDLSLDRTCLLVIKPVKMLPGARMAASGSRIAAPPLASEVRFGPRVTTHSEAGDVPEIGQFCHSVILSQVEI